MIGLHAWQWSCLPSAQRFAMALADPQAAQIGCLARLGLERRTLARMPLTTWQDLQPWIEQLRVQVDPAIERLVPTSGSGAARKLIPWSRPLAGEFRRGIAAWFARLALQHPDILDGPGYWSITPPLTVDGDGCDTATRSSATRSSATPIGFADDTEYLGGRWAGLVRRTLAVDQRMIAGALGDELLQRTCLGLLGCPELRLISVWHPTFLLALLEHLEHHRGRLLEDLPRAQRARLRDQSFTQPAALWPNLRVISAWADGPAAAAARQVQERCPGIAFQAKGLLATEGLVSIPWSAQHPLAITAHVYEFLMPDGSVRWPEDLQIGDQAEVLLTTGGGLRRYRLGDLVAVDGLVGRTPSLRFLGRLGRVSDLVGEKLDELQVSRILADAGLNGALLQAESDQRGYRLLLPRGLRLTGQQADRLAAITNDIEARLAHSQQYATARALGQLRPLHGVQLPCTASELLISWATHRGQRVGEAKPPALLLSGDDFQPG